MRTEICITIDTEFSIAGAFNDFERFPPISRAVTDCIVDGKEYGVGFLLDLFSKHQINATFFIEAINVKYFGLEAMGRIANKIYKRNQDVQLHVHPIWAVFDKGYLKLGNPLFPQNDNLIGRSQVQVDKIIEIGLKAFENWGLPKPLAIRTGSLMIEKKIYQNFSKYGLQLSSSVGVGIYKPDELDLNLQNGTVFINNVMEIPVTSFFDSPILQPTHQKTLQITSCSWPELKSILKLSRKKGVETIVILTHPFELVKKKNSRYEMLTPNRVNIKRLKNLCEFIQENDQDFVSANFRDNATSWQKRGGKKSRILKQQVPFGTYLRQFHNAVNDHIWGY